MIQIWMVALSLASTSSEMFVLPVSCGGTEAGWLFSPSSEGLAWVIFPVLCGGTGTCWWYGVCPSSFGSAIDDAWFGWQIWGCTAEIWPGSVCSVCGIWCGTEICALVCASPVDLLSVGLVACCVLRRLLVSNPITPPVDGGSLMAMFCCVVSRSFAIAAVSMAASVFAAVVLAASSLLWFCICWCGVTAVAVQAAAPLCSMLGSASLICVRASRPDGSSCDVQYIWHCFLADVGMLAAWLLFAAAAATAMVGVGRDMASGAYFDISDLKLHCSSLGTLAWFGCDAGFGLVIFVNDGCGVGAWDRMHGFHSGTWSVCGDCIQGSCFGCRCTNFGGWLMDGFGKMHLVHHFWASVKHPFRWWLAKIYRMLLYNFGIRSLYMVDILSWSGTSAAANCTSGVTVVYCGIQCMAFHGVGGCSRMGVDVPSFNCDCLATVTKWLRSDVQGFWPLYIFGCISICNLYARSLYRKCGGIPCLVSPSGRIDGCKHRHVRWSPILYCCRVTVSKWLQLGVHGTELHHQESGFGCFGCRSLWNLFDGEGTCCLWDLSFCLDVRIGIVLTRSFVWYLGCAVVVHGMLIHFGFLGVGSINSEFMGLSLCKRHGMDHVWESNCSGTRLLSENLIACSQQISHEFEQCHFWCARFTKIQSPHIRCCIAHAPTHADCKGEAICPNPHGMWTPITTWKHSIQYCQFVWGNMTEIRVNIVPTFGFPGQLNQKPMKSSILKPLFNEGMLATPTWTSHELIATGVEAGGHLTLHRDHVVVKSKMWKLSQLVQIQLQLW